jgi:hypothetical protein
MHHGYRRIVLHPADLPVLDGWRAGGARVTATKHPASVREIYIA